MPTELLRWRLYAVTVDVCRFWFRSTLSRHRDASWFSTPLTLTPDLVFTLQRFTYSLPLLFPMRNCSSINVLIIFPILRWSETIFPGKLLLKFHTYLWLGRICRPLKRATWQRSSFCVTSQCGPKGQCDQPPPPSVCLEATQQRSGCWRPPADTMRFFFFSYACHLP